VHRTGRRSVWLPIRRHLSVEPITAARHRLDELRAIVAERAAQLTDALHQGIVGDGDIRPHRREQFVLGNEPAAILDQMKENRERLRPQRHLVTVKQQAAAVAVEHVAVEPQPSWLRRCRAPGGVRGHALRSTGARSDDASLSRKRP